MPDLSVGGAERHAANLLVAMDRSRLVGSVVCLLDRGGESANWDLIESADVPRVELRRARRDYLGMFLGLLAHLRAHQPDVVVMRGFSAEVVGRVAGVLTGVPRLVVWVRNCGDLVPRPRWRRVLQRVLVAATDAVYGVAHNQVPYITDQLGYAPESVRIIHNGIDPAWIERGIDARTADDLALGAELGVATGDTVIGTLAVMRPEKDLTTLLRAVRRVIDERTDVTLVLVGDGPERPRVEALIDHLGLRRHVVLAGHRDDVRPLLRLFDVFVLPSRTVEACPNSLLEAMSAAIPAVCTAVGGVPEILVDGVTGLLVPAEAPEELARALLSLVTDRDRARAMGLAARRRVEEHFTQEQSMRHAQQALAATAGRPF